MLAEILLTSATAPQSDAEAAARALAWIEPRIESAAWPKVELGQANVGGKRLVVDALTGWLELVRTDREADKELLARLDARIRSHLGNRSGIVGEFQNWTDGIAALYFVERELRGRGGRDALERIVRGFDRRQNAEGGWDHGASFGVSFYPSTLIATTNLALVAVGFARRFGLTTDDDVRATGLALLGDVQGDGGGMPYGGRPYLKGVEAGRTCGTVLAYASLGLDSDPRCVRAQRYVLRNIDAIPDGHASTAFHVFMGALACRALGPAAGASFDERVLARVRTAQQADGSFHSIVAGNPDDMALMSDADTDRAYITAFHAGALLASESRIVASLRSEKAAAPIPVEAATAPKLEPVWRSTNGEFGLAVPFGERVLAITRTGHCTWLSMADGSSSAPFELGPGAPTGELESAADEHGVFVWAAPATDDASVVIGGALTLPSTKSAATTAVVFVSADRRGPRWTRSIDGCVIAAIVGPERVLVRTLLGRILVLARADGSLLRELPALGVLPNVAFVMGREETVVVAAESLLACLDIRAPAARAREGSSGTWERKNRLRGLIPPAWTALAFDDDSILAGRTDGSVVALSPSDGATRWEAAVGSSIRRIAFDRKGGRAFAFTHDGRLTAIDEGKRLWTTDIERGLESHREPSLAVSGDRVWLASPARDVIVCCSSDDGRILAETPWTGRSWSVRGRLLLLAGSDGVSALRAP